MSSNLDEVVVRDLLERNARESPGEVFVMFEDGSGWTRQDGLEIAYGAAEALAAAGIRQGSTVAIFLPNGPDFLRAWWGAAVLGATLVPINLSYRGSILDHLLRLSTPDLIVVGEQFDDQLRSSQLGALIKTIRPTVLASRTATPPVLPREIKLWDPHLLLLTSGNDGPVQAGRDLPTGRALWVVPTSVRRGGHQRRYSASRPAVVPWRGAISSVGRSRDAGAVCHSVRAQPERVLGGGPGHWRHDGFHGELNGPVPPLPSPAASRQAALLARAHHLPDAGRCRGIPGAVQYP